MIEGPWFITRSALEDFQRCAPGAVLRDEIARAHFVKLQNDGSEVWRGGKPLRLRFIVRTDPGAGGDAPQLVRIEADHATRASVRARTVRIWDGSASRELLVCDEVHDSGPARRVAYRLASGHWLSGIRGRTRPDEVRELGPPLQSVPEWVRELRGQRSRRSRDHR